MFVHRSGAEVRGHHARIACPATNLHSAEPAATIRGRSATGRLLAVAIVVAAAVLVLGSGAAAEATTSPGRLGALTWQPCPDAPTADCATLRVPVDWSRPRGATIALALARRQATDPTKRIGSLVVNPGGPGGSGVDFIKQSDPTSGAGAGMFSADLRAHFDIVSWDPRGVGLSSPIQCDADLVSNPVSPIPANEAEFDALVAYNRALFDSCRADTGPLLDHIDTASTARDLEAIRAALHEGRLTFWAMSYGTQIGEQYAELFPRNLRAMGLDSTMDHGLGAFPHAVLLAAALEDSYTQFATWCLATPSCPLYPKDPRTVLDEIYTKAQQGTIYVPGHPGQIVTPAAVSDFIRGKLMYEGRWRSMAQEFVDVLNEPAAAPAVVAADFAVNSEEATKTAITCEDHDWHVSTFRQLHEMMKAMNRVAPHTRFSSTAVKGVTQCLGRTLPITNPQARLHVHDAPPILMTNSRYDVATPYPGAVDVAWQLRGVATLLTYDGTSHVSYDETPCVQVATDTYLRTLTTPPPNTHCPAVLPQP